LQNPFNTIVHIDPATTAHRDNYKLLTNLVVPRPIAWVTSQNEQGLINLAPFSFFNAVSSKPIYLIISVGRNDDGSDKDTARNITRSGEFVVNLVTDELLGAMNISAADFPGEESELNAAGLNPAASQRISVPRIAEAQASMECRLFSKQSLGASNTLFIGEVVMFHVADHLIDPRFHISDFAPIGRMGSPSLYCRTTDRFDLPRMTYERYKSDK
jgi:flavin reductase (DIM6/NTAB) family NADH-FMN oxidoreductase RutF